jgi:hypothetical protein
MPRVMHSTFSMDVILLSKIFTRVMSAVGVPISSG